MNNSKLFYLFILGTCLWGCSQPNNKKGITIDLDNNVQKEILFSSFVDSISYIPLETTDDCLIGTIHDIIISDSIIFLLNGEQNCIFFFDRKGNYLRKIDRPGPGPGEYTIINQITYNEKKKCLAIASNKILEFDQNGSFIREFNTPFYASDLHLLNNGNYLLSNLKLTGTTKELVVLTDSLGEIKKTVYTKNPKYGIRSTNSRELINIEDGIHFISPQIENTIYTYNQDSLTKSSEFCILPEISSRFYKSEITPSFLKENYYRSIYRESSNWINLIYCTSSKVRTVLYNKRTKQYIVGEKFKNDMDDKEHIFFLSESKGNIFTNYVKPENEDDNPIIQILHLKQ